jgi:hypothetical protein
MPFTDDTLTMLPAPASFMLGMHSLIYKKTPLRERARAGSGSSVDCRNSGGRGVVGAVEKR